MTQKNFDHYCKGIEERIKHRIAVIDRFKELSNGNQIFAQKRALFAFCEGIRFTSQALFRGSKYKEQAKEIQRVLIPGYKAAEL